jgi:hypothetical protein
MTRYIVLTALFSAVIALGAESAIDPKVAFARLKSLAGEWEADTQMGKVQVSYEVIAGGTAVVERESGEKMPVMLTLYHLDNGRLLLTHYCAAGNQPRMQASAYSPQTGELEFRFLDATNLAEGAGHMRNARFRFLTSDRLESRWEFHENGKLKSTETWQYKRVR